MLRTEPEEINAPLLLRVNPSFRRSLIARGGNHVVVDRQLAGLGVPEFHLDNHAVVVLVRGDSVDAEIRAARIDRRRHVIETFHAEMILINVPHDELVSALEENVEDEPLPDLPAEPVLNVFDRRSRIGTLRESGVFFSVLENPQVEF